MDVFYFHVFYLQSFYYLAIVEDFILRFIWVITFLLAESEYVSNEVITSITAPLEIFRLVSSTYYMVYRGGYQIIKTRYGCM